MMKLKFNLAPWLKTLATLIFFLIVVGGLVRNLGAGLSCPDWPLCQGRIIPVFDIRVFAEYFHRLFAASVSILTFAIAFKIYRDKKLRKQLGGFMSVALLLLASQVVLGGLTVLQLLKSEIVTLHLATGTLFFASILLMAMRSQNQQELYEQIPSKNPRMMAAIPYESQKKWSRVAVFGVVGAGVLYGQIILGGVVSSHGAGLACPDFPKCLGDWWPGLSGIQGLQFIHRLGAATVFLTVTFFVYQILKSSLPKMIRRFGVGILILLLTQISLGIGNVVFRLPVALSVAHLAVAEALFALILMSTYEIRRFQLH